MAFSELVENIKGTDIWKEYFTDLLEFIDKSSEEDSTDIIFEDLFD